MRSVLSKKGQVGSIGPAIIALVIAGVFLILGLVLLQNLRDTDIAKGGAARAGCNATVTTSCADAFQSANATLIGLASFADFWEIIVLAIVISVVIGLLLIVFGRRAR